MARLLALLIVVTGCRGPLVFPCANDGQCLRAGSEGGSCAASAPGKARYCAFRDLNCDSRLRFDPTAGDGLAGTCLGATAVTDGGPVTIDLADGARDLAGMPPPDLTAANPELTWAPVNVGTVGDLYCVTGYDPLHLFIGGEEGIFYSANGGKTWSKQTLPGNAGHIVSIASFRSGTFAVGWYSVILHVIGDSTTWEQQTPPVMGMSDYYGVWGSSVSNLFVGGGAGTVLRSPDGKTWVAQISNQGSAALNSLWGATALNVWGVGNSRINGAIAPIIHTGNAGSTWSTEASQTQMGLYRVWGSGGTDLYAVGEQKVILRGNGSAWSVSRKPSGNANDAFAGLWGSAANDVYVSGTGGALAHSVDGGKTWSDLNSGSGGNLVFVWGSGPNDVWIVGTGGAVLHGTR